LDGSNIGLKTMPLRDDGSEVLVLEIEVGQKINATLQRWDRGDSMEKLDQALGDGLDIETERENIESLVSLVRIVTTIYRQRQYHHADDADDDDLLERDLRDQLNGLIKVLGRQLYRVLFRDQIHGFVVDNLKKNLKLLRIQLQFKDRPDLERWPWEYLYIPREDNVPDSDRFLALITQLALNRRWVAASGEKLHVTGPINILLVVSSPIGFPLDGSSVNTAVKQAFPSARVDDSLQERGPEEIETEGPIVTYDAFVKKISSENVPAEKQWNVIHLMAHGRLSSAGQGQLAFAGKDGRPQWILGSDLAEQIRDKCVKPKSLKIVFLQACESALPGSFVGISSVAQHLARIGVPAVIGMQREIVQGVADAFANAFYRSIASRNPVDFAVKQGRAAIAHNSQEYVREAFGLPVLYLSSYTSLLPEATVGIDLTQPIPQNTLQFDEVTCPRCGTTSAAERCYKCGFLLYCRGCSQKVEIRYIYCPFCEEPRKFVHPEWEGERVPAPPRDADILLMRTSR
jgi:hypothetical protein